MRFSKKINIFCLAVQILLIIIYFVMCWHAMGIPSDIVMTMFFAAFSIEQICTTVIKTSENKYGGESFRNSSESEK